MATREFTDSKGTVWRVWDVTPSYIHPVTKAEEFMEPWKEGWLTFESATEKRRLVAPYPPRWDQYELSQLEVLLSAAERVGIRRIKSPRSVKMVSVEDEAQDDARAEFERTFTSPRGRVWTVRIHECLRKDGSSEMVLRFTAGDSVVDLRQWPEDWKHLTREQYAMLLLDAEPPRRMGKGEMLQRRREDRPQE